MASASDIYGQIEANQSNMDPYLANQGLAPQYFTDEINKLFNYNKGAIQNAAGLEAKAYALPGELMEQYDEEYGGSTGLSSMGKMNSILKNIGQQFGVSNAAWNMVDKAKMRQEDLVGQMNNRYGLELDALQQKHNNLLPIWQQMYADEQANKRAWANRPPAPVDTPEDPFSTEETGTDTSTTVNTDPTLLDKMYGTAKAWGLGDAWDTAAGWFNKTFGGGNSGSW